MLLFLKNKISPTSKTVTLCWMFSAVSLSFAAKVCYEVKIITLSNHNGDKKQKKECLLAET